MLLSQATREIFCSCFQCCLGHVNVQSIACITRTCGSPKSSSQIYALPSLPSSFSKSRFSKCSTTPGYGCLGVCCPSSAVQRVRSPGRTSPPAQLCSLIAVVSTASYDYTENGCITEKRLWKVEMFSPRVGSWT